jgi:hypothetical protein
MVRKGAFGLRLIETATGEPLQEHLDDSHATWVAGEPDKEYWIELTAEEVAGDANIAIIQVDDKCVGHRQMFHKGSADTTRQIGVFKRAFAQGEECFHNALAFARMVPSSDAGDEGNLPSYGTVTVKYHAGERTNELATNGGSRFEAVLGGRAPASSNAKKDGIGMLTSALGASKKSSGALATHRWDSRDLLQELTIRYSTRFGLVVRRIVSDPHPADTQVSNQMGPNYCRYCRQAIRGQWAKRQDQMPNGVKLFIIYLEKKKRKLHPPTCSLLIETPAMYMIPTRIRIDMLIRTYPIK